MVILCYNKKASNVIKFPERKSAEQPTGPIETTDTAEVHRLLTPETFKVLTEHLDMLLKLSTAEDFDFSDEKARSTVGEITDTLKEMHEHSSEYSNIKKLKPIHPKILTLANKAIYAGETDLVRNTEIIQEIKNIAERKHPFFMNYRIIATNILRFLESTDNDLPPAS